MNLQEAFFKLKEIDKKNRKEMKNKKGWVNLSIAVRNGEDNYPSVLFKKDIAQPLSDSCVSALDMLSSDWEVIDPYDDPNLYNNFI